MFNKVVKFVDNKISFICFPYETNSEIHGFEYKKICEYAGDNVNLVARGGFFGGSINAIRKLNGEYYGLLRDTLNEGYMGTEESIFTLMCYKYPEKISCAIINGDGLINKFFEDIKNNTVDFKKFKHTLPKKINCEDDLKVYVLTFNSPPQLNLLLKNFEETYPELLRTKDRGEYEREKLQAQQTRQTSLNTRVHMLRTCLGLRKTSCSILIAQAI